CPSTASALLPYTALFRSIVTVTGTESGHSVSATADATVSPGSCSIKIEKSVSPSTICSGVATSVTYSYKVTNTGSVSATGITVNDDQLGDLTADFKAANGASTTLAPSGSASWTESPSLTITAALKNIVTVT